MPTLFDLNKMHIPDFYGDGCKNRGGNIVCRMLWHSCTSRMIHKMRFGKILTENSVPTSFMLISMTLSTVDIGAIVFFSIVKKIRSLCGA